MILREVAIKWKPHAEGLVTNGFCASQHVRFPDNLLTNACTPGLGEKLCRRIGKLVTSHLSVALRAGGKKTVRIAASPRIPTPERPKRR